MKAFHFFESEKGVRLRYYQSPSLTSPSGTVLILPGRASFIEKYDLQIQNWSSRNYQVFALDWRGQGGSSRISPGFARVHIDDYSTYVSDLEKWLDQVILPKAKKPIIFYAVSMGALISGLYLQKNPRTQINQAIWIVPLFGLHTRPYPLATIALFSKFVCSLGLGKLSVPGNHDPNLPTQDFPNGLTFGWLNATFQALRSFILPKQLEKIEIPIFAARAGKDTVVDNRQDHKIFDRISNCLIKTYPNAPHGIHHAASSFRKELFEDCIQFVNQNFHMKSKQ